MSSPSKSSADRSPAQARIPEGRKRIVIFDTNAYRDFAPGGSLAESRAKAVQLRQCEQAVSVFVLASPTVVWELTAHLADPVDRYYNQCLKSLVMLGEHAVDPANPDGGICLFSDSESTVCRELFHAVPTVNEQGKRGTRRFDKLSPYPEGVRISEFAKQMRNWPGFKSDDGIWDHVIRCTPRDYPLFRKMRPGDHYPEAHKLALRLLDEKLAHAGANGSSRGHDSAEYNGC